MIDRTLLVVLGSIATLRIPVEPAIKVKLFCIPLEDTTATEPSEIAVVTKLLTLFSSDTPIWLLFPLEVTVTLSLFEDMEIILIKHQSS